MPVGDNDDPSSSLILRTLSKSTTPLPAGAKVQKKTVALYFFSTFPGKHMVIRPLLG